MSAAGDSLTRYPQLRCLVTLRDQGWLFIPVTADGVLDQLRAVRTWPSGWAEALKVNSLTDAMAVRTNPDGRITWARDGGLIDVVTALSELPAPEPARSHGL